MSQEASFLTNHFLIAMPALQDPNFSRGVTFVCQHSGEGAMGILVNRVSELRLGDVLSQMRMSTALKEVANARVYIGGPVQPERGFVLHEPCGEWDSSFSISDALCVTTSRDILAAMAEGKGPKHALVALGYAGWSEGQLELEMRDNAWLCTGAIPELIFDTPIEKRWDAAARLVGFDPAMLADHGGHA